MAKVTALFLVLCFSCFLSDGFGRKTPSETDSSAAAVGGIQWPPKGWPNWPFVPPPIPGGGFQWPHWPFVQPPLPAGGSWPPFPRWPPRGAKRTHSAAAAAAPSPTA
ncbi:hypothetical protein ABFS82_06G100300 [Erythranthe guttata]